MIGDDTPWDEPEEEFELLTDKELAMKMERVLSPTMRRELLRRHTAECIRALEEAEANPEADTANVLNAAEAARWTAREYLRVSREKPEESLLSDTETTWERDWVIPDWIPLGEVTLLTGRGGAGKTYLAIELAAALLSGSNCKVLPVYGHTRAEEEIDLPNLELPRNWDSAHQRVLMCTWEDATNEIGWRARRLPSGRWGEHTVPANWSARFHLYAMAKVGPLWAPIGGKHRDTACGLTEAGLAIEYRLRELNPALLIVDPVAAAYMGNENDRGAVRHWLGHLAGLAEEVNCAILLIAHPAKAHDGEASQYSGSTDWRNGVRSVITLRPENENGKTKGDQKGLVLRLDKSNYGQAGRKIWVRWSDQPHCTGLEACTMDESIKAYGESKEERSAGNKAPEGSWTKLGQQSGMETARNGGMGRSLYDESENGDPF